MADELLTIEDLTKRLKITKMTVYKLIHDGKLKASRVGKLFRVSEDSLAKYLKEQEVSSGE